MFGKVHLTKKGIFSLYNISDKLFRLFTFLGKSDLMQANNKVISFNLWKKRDSYSVYLYYLCIYTDRSKIPLVLEKCINIFSFVLHLLLAVLLTTKYIYNICWYLVLGAENIPSFEVYIFSASKCVLMNSSATKHSITVFKSFVLVDFSSSFLYSSAKRIQRGSEINKAAAEVALVRIIWIRIWIVIGWRNNRETEIYGLISIYLIFF